MTEQEVIEEAIDDLQYLISGGCTDNKMDYVKQIELAIKALKRQIPRKPIENKEQNFRYIMPYTCPCCGCSFGETDWANYCYHCGQKFDWSDEE